MSVDESVRQLVRLALDEYEAGRASAGGSAAATAAAGTSAAGTSAAAADAPNRALAGERAGVAVAVGADHGGVALKERIVRQLGDEGYAVRDCGTNGPAAVDYPDFAHAVARLVASGACQWGIVVDGAGIGSCMVANKVPGVRAALCYDLSSARNSREHNHANVLTLGARMIGEGLALEIVATWLATPWGPGRHALRVEKIAEIERHYLKQRDRAS